MSIGVGSVRTSWAVVLTMEEPKFCSAVPISGEVPKPEPGQRPD